MIHVPARLRYRRSARRLMAAVIAGAAILSFGPLALSQQNERRVPPPTSKISLTMEQQHVIKELLKDVQEAPENKSVPETVGASVPASTDLRPLPAAVGAKVPQIRSHQYFVKDGKVFIVDPKDNSIVDVID